MKVVLDTNIWISALIWGGNPEQIILLKEQQLITIAISRPLFKELEKTLNKRKFKPKLELLGLTVETSLNLIQELVTFYPITDLHVPELRDPDDNIILATAIAANATVIITGDQDLLTLVTYQNIPIMTAKTFLSSYFHQNN